MTLDDSCGGLDLGPAHPNARLATELAHSDLRLPRAYVPKGGERRALPSFWREVPRHGGGRTLRVQSWGAAMVVVDVLPREGVITLLTRNKQEA